MTFQPTTYRERTLTAAPRSRLFLAEALDKRRDRPRVGSSSPTRWMFAVGRRRDFNRRPGDGTAR